MERNSISMLEGEARAPYARRCSWCLLVRSRVLYFVRLLNVFGMADEIVICISRFLYKTEANVYQDFAIRTVVRKASYMSWRVTSLVRHHPLTRLTQNFDYSIKLVLIRISIWPSETLVKAPAAMMYNTRIPRTCSLWLVLVTLEIQDSSNHALKRRPMTLQLYRKWPSRAKHSPGNWETHAPNVLRSAVFNEFKAFRLVEKHSRENKSRLRTDVQANIY